MSKNYCPACGSTNSIQEKVRIEVLHEPYGGSKKVTLKYAVCSVCRFEGDIDGSNDAIIESALEELQSLTAKNIIDSFEDMGITIPAFERVLSIPMGTVKRWKTGKINAPELALLRIVKTFPWILTVAECDFNKATVEYELREICSHIKMYIKNEES
jgi:DNA-binding transcriptional regulator YiaG